LNWLSKLCDIPVLLLIRQLGSFPQFQWRYQVVAGEGVVVVVVDGGIVVVVVDGGIVVVVVDGGIVVVVVDDRIVVVVVVGAFVEGGVVDNVVVLEELVVGDVGAFVVDVPAMMTAMAPMSRMPPPRASHRRRRGRR
jgi:hypothetical protein